MTPREPRTYTDEQPGLVHAWRVTRERWWIILPVALLCTGIALALSLSATKKYDGTAKLLFRNNSLSDAILGNNAFGGSIDPQRDAATNTRLVSSTEVAARVRRRLRLGGSADALLAKISVADEENTDLVDVTARTTDPYSASRLANAFADEFVRFRKEADRRKVVQGTTLLRQRLDTLPDTAAAAERTQLEDALQKLTALEAVQTGNAEVVDRARPDTQAVSPRPKRNAILGLLLGLTIGVAIAFLLDLIDRRVKTVEDFERLYRTRTLVGIPKQAFNVRGPETRTAAFEPYRILRNSLAFASFERETRVVLITSAILGEGKTTVAANLARAVALSGQRAVLVEADLRRPSFGSHFEIDERAPGLTTALVGGRSVRDLLRTSVQGMRDLSILPSGPLPPNSAEMLQSAAMGQVLRELSNEADLVIIDAPPLLPVADAQILLDRPEIDACIMVARAYYTRRDRARRARAILDQHRLEPLGLAVTGLRDHATYEYYGSPDQIAAAGGLPNGAPTDGPRVRSRRREGAR
jgi:capsular exopolysaccharide synthesis family protein